MNYPTDINLVVDDLIPLLTNPLNMLRWAESTDNLLPWRQTGHNTTSFIIIIFILIHWYLLYFHLNGSHFNIFLCLSISTSLIFVFSLSRLPLCSFPNIMLPPNTWCHLRCLFQMLSKELNLCFYHFLFKFMHVLAVFHFKTISTLLSDIKLYKHPCKE